MLGCCVSRKNTINNNAEFPYSDWTKVKLIEFLTRGSAWFVRRCVNGRFVKINFAVMDRVSQYAKALDSEQ